MAIVGTILDVIGTLGQIIPEPFEGKYGWSRRLRGQISYRQYDRGIKHLADRGFISISKQNGRRFIKLTKKGQLEILMRRVITPIQKPWDGKWRLIMFDIPESCKEKRHEFRKLLKKNGFHKLQASVYISPLELNRSAIEYLTEAKLIEYIRIFRVDKVDNDRELKKKFSLS